MSTEEKQQDAYFALERIYIKDASFESPRSPGVFQKKWNPEVKMDLSNSSRKIADNVYEVVLAITISVTEKKAEKEEKDSSNSTVFVTEVLQAGVFHIKSREKEEIQNTLSVFCLNILFPYAREAIDNMVTRGNFPPLMIAPVNFNALYQDSKQQKNASS